MRMRVVRWYSEAAVQGDWSYYLTRVFDLEMVVWQARGEVSVLHSCYLLGLGDVEGELETVSDPLEGTVPPDLNSL